MRATHWLRCAAVAAAGASTATAAEAPAGSAASTNSASAAGGTPAAPPPPPTPPLKGAGKKTGPPQRPWKAFTFKSWQLHAVADADARSTMPTTVLYHGEQLGPRPLVILDHSVAASEKPSAVVDACSEASKRYEAMLSSLAWDHGVIYVPLPVMLGEVDLMEKSCRHVCAVMDALGVRWSHVLSHSYGALVAARMAASTTHPHRIGSLLLLDTPLVTEKLVQNAKQREDIAKAKEDVNVPSAELFFAMESLKGDLETPIPHAAAADKSLYEDYLFSSKDIFAEEGLVRDEHRYVPVRHLAQVHHPLQLLVPAKEPVTDVSVHKEFFALRRPAVIKAAENHEDLFSTKCAGEVADVVRAWMQRFEHDIVMKRRFEQAAKEMSQLMGSATPSEKGEGAGEKKTEKKEKKKKSKQ